mmetsp:Transcript_13740/g.24344  ORF Transcript_13740/g.24344 Transcript_13740/m.24344 type:complete len:260 (-) Transcript_13740:1188-1967(-)
MGKKDFHSIYSEACRELGSRPTIKVSHFSDRYDQNKNFAGVIVYHNRGSFTWYNERGVAKGFKGRAIYVILRCTDSWPEEAFKRAGEGMVHDYLYKFLFDNDFNKRQTCCGGFAVMKGTLKYSSVWLNQQSSGSEAQRPWQSDGSKFLSKGEQLLVNIAVRSWKEGGKNIVDIPDDVDMHIKTTSLSTGVLNGSSTPETFSFEGGERVRIRSSVTTPGHRYFAGLRPELDRRSPLHLSASSVPVRRDVNSAQTDICCQQ